MTTTATSIEWTRNDDGTPGRTWNPVSGCTKISAGCDFCYAETIAERFRGSAAFPHGFDVQVMAARMNDPLTWRKATRVFVNSMSDLFHADIDQAWIAEIFGVMAAAQRHTFQLLTKRHARMRTLLNNDDFVAQVRSRAIGKGLPADQWLWPLPNLWLGVSVENQQWANIRIPELLMTPAAVRFLSCEPLLGRITLTHIPWTKGGGTHLDAVNGRHGVAGVWTSAAKAVDWVIVGGESGPKARPMHPDWARSLRDQCSAASVPFFFKQWGQWGLEAPLDSEGRILRGKRGMGMTLANDGTLYAPGDLTFPDGPRYGEAIRADHGHAHLTGVYSVGKKAAGRELDGREHNAFPAVSQ